MAGTEIAVQHEVDDDLGPAMLALDARRRAFVQHLFFLGVKQKATEAAKRAGYSAKSYNGLKVTAYRLMHSPEIQAAIHEEAAKSLSGLKPLAVAGLAEVLKNPEHPRFVDVCRDVLDRSGLGAKTEHKVTVERVEDDSTRLRKIKDYCDILGLTVEERRKLLGNFSEVIDVPAVEVTDGE